MPAFRLLPLLLLAACASDAPRWERPNMIPAIRDRDLADCRLLAPPAVLPVPMPIVAGQPPRPHATEATREAEAVDRCMRGKGYRLVPAPSA
jgi:hypothetical protein